MTEWLAPIIVTILSPSANLKLRCLNLDIDDNRTLFLGYFPFSLLFTLLSLLAFLSLSLLSLLPVPTAFAATRSLCPPSSHSQAQHDIIPVNIPVNIIFLQS